MLPPFIIEQIRKREEERLREGVQPQLEIDIPRAPTPRVDAPPDSSGGDRGILILELR